MDIKEVKAKTILSKCGIPGIDYVINPYTGCQFGCIYCYASFMGRFIQGKTIQDWGNYIFAKVNAPELLKKEINKLKNRGEGIEIFLSSVTDPYQGLEAKHKLTRQCLKVLADYGFEGYVSILTKSNLVLRDIDIFKKLKHVTVGMTVTSTNDSISRYFEKYAPSATDRFKTLKKLNKKEVQTYAFIGPLLPHYVAHEEELESVFKKLQEVGTRDIFVEHLNLSGYIRGRLLKEMKNTEPEIMDKFYSSQSKKYRKEIDKLVAKLTKKYSMKLLTGGTIFHKEYQKKKSKKKQPWKHKVK